MRIQDIYELFAAQALLRLKSQEAIKDVNNVLFSSLFDPFCDPFVQQCPGFSPNLRHLPSEYNRPSRDDYTMRSPPAQGALPAALIPHFLPEPVSRRPLFTTFLLILATFGTILHPFLNF